MKNRIIYTVIVLIVIILGVACFEISKQASSNDSEKEIIYDTSTLSITDNTALVEHNDKTTSGAVDEIIEESDYHQIIRSNSIIYCYFYNDKQEVVRVEGPMGKLPIVARIEDGLLRFTLQSGTGNYTKWGYYYDTENMVFSKVFQGMFDECDGKVACVEKNKVIISDIFDSSEYYKEISVFSHPFSEVATPMTKIEFSQDGKSIKVSYLTGSDYKEVTEVFSL